MNILRNRAIKRYASQLPHRLAKDYGASKFYTPRQIDHAVAKLKLSPTHIAYGYAMFLDKADFASVNSTPELSYDALRIEFLRHIPAAAANTDPPAVSSISATNFGPTWPTPGDNVP